MLKGLGDMGKLMKQAQEMQAKMAEVQERMKTLEAEGSSGAGLVSARATAEGEVKRLSVDPSLLGGGEEKEVLEDLIVAAVNDAIRKAREMGQAEMAKLTEGPSSVLGRAPATLRPGNSADIVVFDPDRSWVVDPTAFASKGHNTPLAGQQLKGQVMLTMSRGNIIFRRGSFGVGTGMLQQASKLEGILNDER